jgi:hypothetical protein
MKMLSWYRDGPATLKSSTVKVTQARCYSLDMVGSKRMHQVYMEAASFCKGAGRVSDTSLCCRLA